MNGTSCVTVDKRRNFDYAFFHLNNIYYNI